MQGIMHRVPFASTNRSFQLSRNSSSQFWNATVVAIRPLSDSSSSNNKNGNDMVTTTTAAPKARRRRRLDLDGGNVPSYKEFMHRMSVVHMYRDYLKAIRRMPGDQSDLWNQVKREFQASKKDTDSFNVKRALTEGKRQLTELEALAPSPSTAHVNDEDSWINTKDPVDPRGRVGEGWPWGS